MMYSRLFFIALVWALFACQPQQTDTQTGQAPDSVDPLSMDNLYAWCIVPFDSEKRTPAERMEMLKELGFTRYAYDWRTEHLATMPNEIKLARKNGIDIMAVWIWIDANADQPGKLSDNNEQALGTVLKWKLNTQIWVGFQNNYFEGETEADKIKAGTEMVAYLSDRAKEGGNTIALYNHGDWFGEPANQVKIIEALPEHDLGIIYNFHHAHEQLDRYDEIVEVMMPHLQYVNLNGMRAEGPKIMTIGSGNMEQEMIQKLLDAGYTGEFGVLGHVEDRDVKEVLSENLEGLKTIQAAM